MTKKKQQRAKKNQPQREHASQKVEHSQRSGSPQQDEPLRRMQPQHKRGRLWLFQFAVIFVIPGLFLVALEMGLRAFGFGVPTGFTYKQEVDGEKRILNNSYFLQRFLRSERQQEGSHFSLPLEKPKGTYRVFVLGGSAAQGIPKPLYGMTRILHVMLRDQYPGVDFDVINTATGMINSHVILPIARHCTRLESDLLVIYMGNNEVVGPYGARTAPPL